MSDLDDQIDAIEQLIADGRLDRRTADSLGDRLDWLQSLRRRAAADDGKTT